MVKPVETLTCTFSNWHACPLPGVEVFYHFAITTHQVSSARVWNLIGILFSSCRGQELLPGQANPPRNGPWAAQSSSPKPFSDEETQLFYNIREHGRDLQARQRTREGRTLGGSIQVDISIILTACQWRNLNFWTRGPDNTMPPRKHW